MEYLMECPNDSCRRNMKEVKHDDDKVEFFCENPKCRSHRVTAIWGLQEREQHREWEIRERK